MDIKLKDRQKVYKVINSCTTHKQLEGAKQYVKLFIARYNVPQDSKFANSLQKACSVRRLKLKMDRSK